MKRYNPADFESKWQATWEKSGIYRADDESAKPKKYILEFFPYPSGTAMHVGHARNYVIGDGLARFWRMNGYNVLHPMGWDAFGLPAENYALKNHISPRQAIADNTARFKKQLMQLGFSYDWTREINSTDPNYYRWTQYFFLLLYKRGLAYQQESQQWWCPVDKTVLANEQVEAGRCWRCDSLVEKKSLRQWFFKITDYAERLLEDLDDLNWPEAIKSMQRNWIGRSVGAEIEFAVSEQSHSLRVFTTRPDTLYGATFMVLAPEHPLIKDLVTQERANEVDIYIKAAQQKSDLDRAETNREKTGVFTGAYAINPVNREKIPIWIADYVLMGYGTGAIMAVPAHDQRDFEFAKQFALPITRVIMNDAPDEDCTPEEGTMINSGAYDGLESSQAREKIVADLQKEKLANESINYKMRDWLISRQRYWGAPIPIIHCEKDGAVAVPESDLPVLLPEITDIEPGGNGQSPLANISEFVQTTCPKCGQSARRETDTMDGFACSSWYFLRFSDPHNLQSPFSPSKSQYWLPVDTYIGGAEHAVMHLLYARFWTKVMHDAKMVDFSEPFTTLLNQGLILAPDGNKMSKSKNNTIEPDILIEEGYGADSIRLMELFIAPWDQAVNWSTDGISGVHRFLSRVWTLVGEYKPTLNSAEKESSDELPRLLHPALKKVTEDIVNLRFNTAIATMMELVNELYKHKDAHGFEDGAWAEVIDNLLLMLAPLAPHMSEELWHSLGHNNSIHTEEWPKYDPTYLDKGEVSLAVQINGRLRGEITQAPDVPESEAIAAAAAKVAKYLSGQKIKKTIYIKDKIINFVI